MIVSVQVNLIAAQGVVCERACIGVKNLNMLFGWELRCCSSGKSSVCGFFVGWSRLQRCSASHHSLTHCFVALSQCQLPPADVVFHSCRITCERSESAQQRRTALYKKKSDQ